MQRREFLAGASAALATAATIRTLHDKNHEIRETIVAWTKAFSDPAIGNGEYLAFMTDDYHAVENGVSVNRKAELKAREQLPAAYRRVDMFDFGESICAVVTRSPLSLSMQRLRTGKYGVRHGRWKGQVNLRHDGAKWQVAFLRSDSVPTQAGHGLTSIAMRRDIQCERPEVT